MPPNPNANNAATAVYSGIRNPIHVNAAVNLDHASSNSGRVSRSRLAVDSASGVSVLDQGVTTASGNDADDEQEDEGHTTLWPTHASLLEFDVDADPQLVETRHRMRLLLTDPKFSICGAASMAAAAVWAVIACLSSEQWDEVCFLFASTGVTVERAADIIAGKVRGRAGDMQVCLVPDPDRGDKVGFEWLRPNHSRGVGLHPVKISRIFLEFAAPRDWSAFVADVLRAVRDWPRLANDLARIDKNSELYAAKVYTGNDSNVFPTGGAGAYTVYVPLYVERVASNRDSVRLVPANRDYVRTMIARGVAREDVNYFNIPLSGDVFEPLILDEAIRVAQGATVAPQHDTIDHSVMVTADVYRQMHHHDLSYDQVLPESTRIGERYWAPIPGVDVYKTIVLEDGATARMDDEGDDEDIEEFGCEERGEESGLVAEW